MKIVHIIPGTGDVFYCQNCMRDKELVMALRAKGHDVVLVPMYLPLFTEGEDMGAPHIPVFYGAVGVYLAQMFPWFRVLPKWVRNHLDSRRLLTWVAKRAGTTRAHGLEDMTLSVLNGENGGQAAELDRLVSWLSDHEKPDLVHLSNALLLGLAGQIRRDVGVPVVCTLQDEDSWVDAMDPVAAQKAWLLMTEKSRDVVVFIPVSRHYKQVMQNRMKEVPPEKFNVIPIGVDADSYGAAQWNPDQPVIGYLSRMSESLGLGLLVEAFIQIRERGLVNNVKLKITGGKTPEDDKFIQRLKQRLAATNLLAAVEFCPVFDRQSRRDFIQSLTIMSVPMPHPEAFGMFMLEAMASGVPVVQPRLGASHEIVEATGGGVCYDPADPSALAREIEAVLLDETRWRQMSQAGRIAVREHYEIGKVAGMMAGLYEKVVSQFISLLTFCVMVCGMTTLASENTAVDWPSYHDDAGLRGVSPVVLPDALTVKWRTRLGAPAVSPPVVCGDHIFIAIEKGGLLAVDRQGKIGWSVSLAKPANSTVELQESFSTPPLCVAGMVLVGSDQGFLHAFEASSGAVRWKQKIGDDLLGSPNWVIVDKGGKIEVLVMSRNDGILKLLSVDDGHLVWASEPVSRCDTPPAVGLGVAVFGACDSVVHIQSLANGKSLWKVSLGEHGPMAGGAAVDGTQAFIGTRDGSVVCVDVLHSTIIWTSRCASNEVFTTPAVTSNRVVVGSNDGRIYCLDRFNGKTVWSFTTTGNPLSPSIAGDKVVVASEGTLFLLNLSSGRKVWAAKPGDSLTSPAITGDGVIVGTDDGFLILYGFGNILRE